MTRGQRRTVVGLVVAAVAVIIVIGVWPEKPRPPGGGGASPGGGAGIAGTSTVPVTPPATGPAETGPAQSTELPLLQRDVGPAEQARAATLMAQGMALTAEGKLVEARGVLSDALNTAALAPDKADAVRGKLAELADKTLFTSRVVEGDPCTFSYRLQAGDLLINLERQKFRLHVPEKLLEKINGVPDASKLQAGQSVKLIRGPFHGVIAKGAFRMDLYLEEPETHRMVFVRRLRVGTGSNGSTPAGEWRVAQGRKMTRAAWTPPASSNLPQRKILPDEPGYPLGRMGYWIGLEGIGANRHTVEDGYGIHGTNDPSSIGKASSLGCIRLADDDIDMVYSLLYPVWSRVSVQP